MRLRLPAFRVDGSISHHSPMLPPSSATPRSDTHWFLRPVVRWRDVLMRRKRSAALVAQARALSDPEKDRVLVGLWAFFRLVPSSRSEALDLAAERFAVRSSREPGLERMLDDVEARMRELDNGHAERHFLAISGYDAEDLPPAAGALETGIKQDRRFLPDRAARAHRVRPGMLATLLVLFMVALASRSADPLADSLTTLAQTQPVLFGSLGETVRGHREPVDDDATEALVEALGHIEGARTSLLGIHTGYERGTLAAASSSLERALSTPITSPPLADAVRELKVRIDELIAAP